MAWFKPENAVKNKGTDKNIHPYELTHKKLFFPQGFYNQILQFRFRWPWSIN